jgi:hypothetical protein
VEPRRQCATRPMRYEGEKASDWYVLWSTEKHLSPPPGTNSSVWVSGKKFVRRVSGPDGHYSERSITRHEVPCTCSRTISTVGCIVWNLGSCPCKLKNGRKLLPEAIWVDLSSRTPNGFTIALLHKKIQRPHFFPWAINHSVAMLIRSQGTQETHIPSS